MTKTAAVVITLNLIALSGLGFLAWEIGQIAVAIEEKANRLAKLEAGEERLTALRAEMETTGAARAAITHYFIDQNTLPNFLEELEGLAVGRSISLKLNNVAVATDPKTATTLKVDLDFTSSWSRALNFVALIENLPHELRFNHLDLKRTQASTTVAWQGLGNLEVLSFTP
ncbi:MAG: hypothetical protein HYT48_00160 [Candidatus Vogelbacteria bacterium]|nr:hypothetical protein [Candidatus Vogelbacteria bacterium]